MAALMFIGLNPTEKSSFITAGNLSFRMTIRISMSCAVQQNLDTGWKEWENWINGAPKVNEYPPQEESVGTAIRE